MDIVYLCRRKSHFWKLLLSSPIFEFKFYFPTLHLRWHFSAANVFFFGVIPFGSAINVCIGNNLPQMHKIPLQILIKKINLFICVGLQPPHIQYFRCKFALTLCPPQICVIIVMFGMHFESKIQIHLWEFPIQC